MQDYKMKKIFYGVCDQKILKVLKYNLDISYSVETSIDNSTSQADDAISESMAILKSLNPSLLDEFDKSRHSLTNSLKCNETFEYNAELWDDLVLKAEENFGEDLSIDDILLPEEIALAEEKLAIFRGQFDDLHKLDKVDWLIACTAGIVAALVDIFLVDMPKHPGFLGGEGSEGGSLSNFIKEKMQSALTPEELRTLEKENWVPYDPAHSKGLNKPVPGLGPRSHRFQSLGHDPLLGFLFGVRDILNGEFTAIDKYGNYIRQSLPIPEEMHGMGVFDAILRQLGHLASDAPTPAGLPPPLLPLFQLIQEGSFGNKEYTVGQLVRIMYREGYDFSHFLAMSVPVLIIETIVRGGYLSKRLYEGNSFMDSIPVGGQEKIPKLHTMLFTAHLIAASANAGKFIVTENPLAINYPQWMIFIKSLISQINWITLKKEKLRNEFVGQSISNDWEDIYKSLGELMESAL